MRIEEFFRYCERITALVGSEQDMSLLADTNSLLQKQLAVGAASAFEVDLCARVRSFVELSSAGNRELASFFEQKAITRQYHSWFDWSSPRANSFYGLFGSEFKGYMKKRAESDERLRESVRAFLELGQDRNEIVHGDFLNHSYGKTLDEVYGLYCKAKYFVELFPDVLLSFRDEGESSARGSA